jgi:hypothetical protein
MSAYFTTRQTVSKAKSRTLRLLLTRSGFPKTKKLPYQNSNEDESPILDTSILDGRYERFIIESNRYPLVVLANLRSEHKAA